MAIQITPEQRDALYEQILDRLHAIGDLPMAAEAGNFEVADRLARTYADDLQLLRADLEWGEGSGQPIELETPADVLRRIFERVGREAAAMYADEEAKAAHMLELHERHRILIDVCSEGLEELGGGER